MVITFEKSGDFYRLLNKFLSHLGFVHAHAGVRMAGGKEVFARPGEYVDRIDHVENAGDVIVVSGLKKAFVFVRVTPLVEKRVKGALKLYAGK